MTQKGREGEGRPEGEGVMGGGWLRPDECGRGEGGGGGRVDDGVATAVQIPPAVLPARSPDSGRGGHYAFRLVNAHSHELFCPSELT